MSNETQEKTLKEVLELERYLISAEKQLFKIKSETYSEPPEAPVCQTVTRTYPEIVSTVKFNKALAFIPAVLLIPLSLIWIAIYYFSMYKPKKEADIERIRNSEEYRAECARLDSTYDAQQQEFEQQYAIEKKKYDTEILPNYNNQRNAWTIKHENEIEKVMNDLMNAKNKLANIYDTTRIVPAQYRNIDALQYIYDLVSTSDYDVTYAINNYDIHRQRTLEEARLQEQQIANDLASEQAELLAEQNEIAEKARRDAKIANVIGMVQKHNSNKYLKDISKK